MTNEEVYEIVKENKEMNQKYFEGQQKINEMVIRHDEKLKNIWRIPVISGGTVGIITGIALLVFNFIK